MTFENFYKDIIYSSEWWSYYSSDNRNFSHLFQLERLDETGACKYFINDYISRGEKERIKFADNVNFLLPSRIKHIVSCFFMGLGLFKCSPLLKDNILKNLPTPRLGESRFQLFKYIWFLACLFHDLGYAIEDSKQISDKQSKHFNKYLSGLPKRPLGIPNTFNKTILKQYAKWRICCHSCYDHGIIGGIILYHELSNFRKDLVKKYQLEDNGYVKDNLYWGPELDKYFSLSSWIISCHNIWTINSDSKELSTYNYFGLSQLIRSKEDKGFITIESSPLLLLFCLADSLEPIKRIETIKWFKDIRISISDHNIVIDLNDLPDNLKKAYEPSIMGINGWLTDIKRNGHAFTINLE